MSFANAGGGVGGVEPNERLLRLTGRFLWVMRPSTLASPANGWHNWKLCVIPFLFEEQQATSLLMLYSIFESPSCIVALVVRSIKVKLSRHPSKSGTSSINFLCHLSPDTKVISL